MRIALALLFAAGIAAADESEYRISPRDAPEARSYNAHRGDIDADYDGDKLPNSLDSHNDQSHLPKWRQDWDADDIPNFLDLENGNEYKR